LQLYSRLDNLSDETEISKFCEAMADRFGPLPIEVLDLVETVRLRWLAQSLGCEKLIIKNETVKCYLLPSDNETYYQSEMFGKILAFVSSHSQRCRLKETQKRLVLVISEVEGIRKAKDILYQIDQPKINITKYNKNGVL
jgi:transcription-repair coupling factor (superfamily II helicase)